MKLSPRAKIASIVLVLELLLLVFVLQFSIRKESRMDKITQIGMLFVMSNNCMIPEGCGPSMLCAEDMKTCIPLEGGLDSNDSGLIVQVSGTRQPYICRDMVCPRPGPSEKISVSEYKVINKIPYHDFLVKEGSKAVPVWNKTFGWEIRDEKPVLKVRMTNTFGDQSFVELWYDGNTGEFLKRIEGK